MIAEIRQEILDTYQFRHVIFNFVRSTLKLRYQRTVLGFFWSVLGPMIHYLVVGLVFSYTMKSGIENYAAYVFAGALYYNVISGAVLRAPSVLLANEHYVKKIYIPKLVFVLDMVCAELVNFFLGFGALLLLALAFQRVSFSIHFVMIPLALLLACFLSIGLASILSVAGVYFRDLAHIIPIVMQATFFMTPVLYDIGFMPPKFQILIKLNPLTYFVEVFRMPIVYNQWPQPSHVVFCVVFALAVFLTGLFVLKAFDNKIVFRL